MYYSWRDLTRQMMFFNNTSAYIFDYKIGDVNGDGIMDYVYAVGQKPSGIDSPFADNIQIVVLSPATGKYYSIPLRSNAGYNPTIFLGDFTGDGVQEILITIDSGGSGGGTFNYIYSFKNNEPKLMFDFEKYNEMYTYEVIFRNNFKVEVISRKPNKRYVLDIAYKGKEYLTEIYDSSGELKEPLQGFVNPLGGLYAVDYERDGTYELNALQRVAGRYNADSLGYVQNVLKWNGKNFELFNQNVLIYG